MKKTVLLAIVGTSPAILSETVWALAHSEDGIIPDEVAAITTETGKAKLEETFFGAGRGWESLKRALEDEGCDISGKLSFGPVPESIRIPANREKTANLKDIASTGDNAIAADFFLSEIRKYTEDPSTVLYVSIAGGRKTMSALMLSCMTLLGRECDHVLHVLVNPPYDAPLSPPFLFPCRGLEHKTPGGDTVMGCDAMVELIDLPYVRMRGLYREKFSSVPPSYSELVRAVQKEVPKAEPPSLKADFKEGRLYVDGVDACLNNIQFMVFSVGFFLRPRKLHDVLCSIRKDDALRNVDWVDSFKEGSRFKEKKYGSDLTKVKSEIKGKLEEFPSLAPYIGDLFPRKSGFGKYDESRISADIGKLKELIRFDSIENKA